MADPNQQDSSDEQDLESMLNRLEQLDPAELVGMNPEQIQELLGGAKLGEVFAQFQKKVGTMAAKMAEEQGIDLSQLDDDEEDWLDGDEAFASAAIDDSLFVRPAQPDGSLADFPGSEQLWQQAHELDPEERLQLSIEIKSPPVTDIEKVYYSTCHYRLVFDIFDTKVMFRDVTTPRQDYLHDKGWPAMLTLPRKSWPDLEPLWDTIHVAQFNMREAFRSQDNERLSREDLVEFARQALAAGLSN